MAVKVLRAADTREPDVRELIREAAVLRAIESPNLSGYRAVLELPEGGAALVTDHEPGGNLDGWVAKHGARTPQETARLGLQLVSALEVLHNAGVLHRGLAPPNVLASGEGSATRLRVTDVGIPRSLRGRFHPGYAAPEQSSTQRLTAATDLYALGALLEYLATGAPPTSGPLVLPDMLAPGALELTALIEHLCAERPDDRSSLSDARRVLEAIVLDRTLARTPPPTASAAARSEPTAWRPSPALVTTAVLLVVLVAIGALALALAPPADPAPSAPAPRTAQ